MVRPGIINLDFADVRSVMDEMGKAMMGTGEASGEDRAIQAAEKAIANPLLDEISLQGARGVLINITGGHDLTLFELDEAANRIREEVDQEANIIVGSTLDTGMEGTMRVSVVATGIDASEMVLEVPVPRRSMAEPLAPVRAATVEETPAVASQQAPASSQPSMLSDLEPELDAYVPEEELSLFDDLSSPAADNSLPPPVYQPERQGIQQPVADPSDKFAKADVSVFIAPKPPAPGKPSVEAMARLQAAVNKAPKREAEQQQVAAEKTPRFGINNLINRMTGHGPDQSTRKEAPKVHPSSGLGETVDVNSDQERADIPAFLRRQAN